jgi:hypothetical protein
MNKWKKANDEDALKFFNCERILELEAEQLGLPRSVALTMATIKIVSNAS